MTPKTYTIIEWFATGAEAMGIGLTLLIGGPYIAPICAGIPIAKQAICSICKLFVKE